MTDVSIPMASAGVGVGGAVEPPLTVAAQSRVRPFSIERTEQWTLRSKAGRMFEISVSLPKGPPPAGGYPVMYVLDPSLTFVTLADTVRAHEDMFGQAMVIGVGYPSDAEIRNRVFDLTPITDMETQPKYMPKEWGGWGPAGGADAFLAFIQEELKPVIAGVAPVDHGKQALFGHSLGGLFTLYTLFTCPGSFDTYIATSPSIYWGGKVLLKQLPGFKTLQIETGARRRVLIAVGGLEGKDNPEERRWMEKAKTANMDRLMRETKMVPNAAALAEELRPLAAHGLEVAYVEFPGETHTSVIPACLSRGARLALAGWFGG